jgi:small subunit ribosomal protein S11
MGKKRIVTQKGQRVDKNLAARSLARTVKKKIARGILSVQSTFNNTIASLSDAEGNVVMQSSSGALGFKGAKKGTPFAAAKVGELLGERAAAVGIKEVDVVVKGVGSGRESVIRSFAAFGVDLRSIVDRTPVPFNGPRPPKPRRI